MSAFMLILAIMGLCCWAVVRGGTNEPQPKPIIYDDDHDVSGLLEED